MKPLRELREEYKNAHYVKLPDGELQTLVSVDRPDNAYQWYDEEFAKNGIELVPRNLMERFVELSRPQMDMSLIGDKERVEDTLEHIITCRVTNVVETAPFFDHSDTKKMVLEDLLVVEPLEPELIGAKIYVPHHAAGTFKSRRLRHMVGQVVPVKIADLKERRYENYHVYKSIKNSYVLEGDIGIAQFLKNREFTRSIPRKWMEGSKNELTKEYKAFLNKTYYGVISHFNSAGVFLVTKENYTFFIGRDDYSYATKSSIYKFVDTVDDSKVIEFKYTGLIKHIVEPREFGLSNFRLGNTILLRGEHISFETSPYEAITQMIDNKEMVGRTFTAYIVQYDPQKNHLIELEGFPGAYVKLRHNKLLNPQMMRTNEPISVVVKYARWEYGKKGNILLKVNCEFNALFGKKQEMLADFFSSN